MTTRLNLSGPRPNVSVAPTAARTTAQPARPFQQLVRAGTSAIVATAEQAATRLPGGPILAAALRPGYPEAGDARAPEGARAALSGSGSVGLPSGSDVSGPSGGVLDTGMPAASGDGLGVAPGTTGIDGVLARNSNDNLHYLELQERISQESRTFTALSNVLKARHETVKNAISNIR